MSVRIERMVYGGAGVSEDVAVPFSLPGELVEVSGSEPVQILEASADRVAARCPHFGSCGGCQYQHASYAAQARIKTEILRETLADAGLTVLPDVQVHTSEPWEYRNRIRLRIGMVEGALRMGYNRRGSYEMLPIRECPIAASLLVRAGEGMLAAAAGSVWARQLTEMELFCNGDQSRLQMTLFVRSEGGLELPRLCEALREHTPELSGAGIIVVGESGKRDQPGTSWGAAGLKYEADGRDYWVSRGSFFQVNRFLVGELVRLVTAGQSGKLAWDLYAGVGLFSRALLESFAEVVGVETVAGDLRAVLGANAVAMSTAEFLGAAVLQRERPDLVVMDPPRAGLGAEVCVLLVRVRAPQMVYVSCDPLTLARDLRAMVDSGYTIAEVHLVDLFPQTFHLETVVVLNR